MKNELLLPHRFKHIGWILLIPATVVAIILIIGGFSADWVQTKVFAFWHDNVFSDAGSFDWILVDVTQTLVGSVWIIGAMLVSFSKEKREDEYIARLRLTSLMWSVLVNYLLLLIGFVFIYGSAFLNVMIYNMFTVLIIFIGRFNYMLYKNSRITDEK